MLWSIRGAYTGEAGTLVVMKGGKSGENTVTWTEYTGSTDTPLKIARYMRSQVGVGCTSLESDEAVTEFLAKKGIKVLATFGPEMSSGVVEQVAESMRDMVSFGCREGDASSVVLHRSFAGQDKEVSLESPEEVRKSAKSPFVCPALLESKCIVTYASVRGISTGDRCESQDVGT